MIKPVLQYPGSKWMIADRLASMIPEHHTYCEPFFGSGAVFFRKQPSDIELINDLDNDVPNVFRCIRDAPDRLAALVTATPYSRYEYEAACKSEEQDDFSRAANFLIRCWQGYGFRANSSRVGWRNDVHGRESMYALRNWYELPDTILEVAERLRRVQIDNRPALEVIRRFNYEDVFLYVDPPYLLDTRYKRKKQYNCEMADRDHVELLEELSRSKARIMVSGYDSELYDSILTGWKKEYFNSQTMNGRKRTETVWMNYERQLNISDFQQQTIFKEE